MEVDSCNEICRKKINFAFSSSSFFLIQASVLEYEKIEFEDRKRVWLAGQALSDADGIWKTGNYSSETKSY